MTQVRADAGSEMAGPSVSVVIPTYQRRDYARRAVESVLAQSYENFELIVVDDGSTDGTRAAVAGLDRRIRYLWQENRGLAAARNAGVLLARAPLVAFLDSDDRWRPKHLTVVSETFARHPEAVLVCTKPRYLATGRRRARNARLLDALPLLLVENFVGAPSSVAVRKAALDAVGGFDEALTVSQGRELWLRLATQGPFCILERRTIVVQVTRGSMSDLGRSTGQFAPTDELIATRIAAEVARLERPDSGKLAARVRGRRYYAAAYRGLDAHDDEAVSHALEQACELLPELSREAYLVGRRIMFIASDRRERLHHLATAAARWPDRRADTAMFLRGLAILLALRLGRLRTAIGLAARWPLTATPAFLIRTIPMWIRVGEWVTGGWTHRGGEPSPQQTTASTAR